MKHLLLSILLVGCATTQKEYPPIEGEAEMIDECAVMPQTCVNLAVEYAVRRDYETAIIFADEACEMGYRKGCMMKIDLEGSIRRIANARGAEGHRDANLINLFQQSARQMGTVGGIPAGGSRPTPIRCVQKWDMFAQANVTVCE